MSDAPLTVTPGCPENRGFEIKRLCPPGAPYATIDWPLPDDNADEAIAPLAASFLCRALLGSGRLAFRCDDPPLKQDGMFFPEPKLSLVRKLRGMVLSLERDATFAVLVTNTEHAAQSIFTWSGWRVALQAVLVHDPASGLSPIVHALQHGLDWRDRPLPPGCRLLFGPGHDGGFALVAAASEDLLAAFLARVNAALA